MRRSAVLLATFLIAGTLAIEGRFHIVANWAASAAFALSFGWIEGLSVAQVTADPWYQTMTLEGFTYRRDTYALGVERITLPFSRLQMFSAIASYFTGERNPTEPETIKKIALRNVTIDAGPVHYAMKSADILGLSLAQSDIEDIFDPTITHSIADGITKLSASKIIIPEVIEKAAFDSKPQISTIKKIELDGIFHGAAAAATIESIESTFDVPQVGLAQGITKTIKISNFDVSLGARIFSEALASDEVPLKTLYDRLDIASATLDEASTHSQINLSAISSKAAKVRPFRTLPTSFFNKPATTKAGETPSNILADILRSLEVGSLGIQNVRFTLGLNNQAVSGEVSNVSLAGLAAAAVDAISIESCHVAGEDHGQSFYARIASFAVHGLGLSRFLDQPADAMSANPLASFVPSIFAVHQVRLKGFDLALPDGRVEPDPHGTASIQVAKWDLDGVDSDGLPASFTSDVEHLTIDLAELPFGRFPLIADLGYDRIDLSMRFNADLDVTKQQLTIHEISLADPNIGAVELAGSLGNATQDLFSSDPSKVISAALAMRVERIGANVTNAGFFERFIAAAAKKDHKTPAAVQADYQKSIPAVLPAFLGKSAAAQSISTAAAKFVATPKSFRIVATAREGIAVADLMQMNNPSALLEKLSVSAEANQ